MLDANAAGGDLAHLALSHLDDGRSTTRAGSTLVGAAIGLATSRETFACDAGLVFSAGVEGTRGAACGLGIENIRSAR